jgi:hypothetical protein
MSSTSSQSGNALGKEQIALYSFAQKKARSGLRYSEKKA